MRKLTVPLLLLLSVMSNVVHAKDTLVIELDPTQQSVQPDSHIGWHDFRVRSGNYPQVNASMTDGGVITLRGFADPFEGDRLEELARRVTGATKIINSTEPR